MYGRPKHGELKIGKPGSNVSRVIDRMGEWDKGPFKLLLCCELMLPVALVVIILAAVADATVTTAQRVRIVPRRLYSLYRGGRHGARAAAAAAFAVCGAATISAGVALAFIMCAAESGGNATEYPVRALALSSVIAGIAAFSNIRLRRICASLEEIKPLTNETSDNLPETETLVRGASASNDRHEQELLRPNIKPSVPDDDLLVHVSGSSSVP